MRPAQLNLRTLSFCKPGVLYDDHYKYQVLLQVRWSKERVPNYWNLRYHRNWSTPDPEFLATQSQQQSPSRTMVTSLDQGWALVYIKKEIILKQPPLSINFLLVWASRTSGPVFNMYFSTCLRLGLALVFLVSVQSAFGRTLPGTSTMFIFSYYLFIVCVFRMCHWLSWKRTTGWMCYFRRRLSMRKPGVHRLRQVMHPDDLSRQRLNQRWGFRIRLLWCCQTDLHTRPLLDFIDGEPT